MSDRSILDHPELPPGRVVRRGPLPHQVHEVFGDPISARAWVVLIHGGFWRAEWDRTHLRPLAKALSESGYAVALLEYVRAGMAGGGWPGTFEDVAEGLAAVRTENADLGRGDTPVVLVGHSAGGHLAAWLLHRPEAVGVRGAVSLAGCLDLHLVAELGLDDGAAELLMGAAPDTQPARWEAADPARRGETPYGMGVVHGDADEWVPIEVSRSWWRACARPGRDRMRELAGVGHFALIDPTAAAYEVLIEEIEALARP
ncbi:alpha/beta hydrolase family protein [Ornithinimicrobium sp. Y1847]|uniref:alpha/beta hydrolase family protein n=1 Tax=Ornithinimicrobium sp. Y1847 TaxID=3405419 RepID=UPI003B685E74